MIFRAISHVRERRAVLRTQFSVDREFEALEESCIPSYLHGNPLASGISWWRLFTAATLYKKHASGHDVLDFGAGSGELFYMLGDHTVYDFIEEDEALSRHIETFNKAASHRSMDALGARQYGAIFALDSLEHNDDFESILKKMAQALKPGGILILSGPTENWIYRLGRRIAGFSGHYHKTTIYDIEAACVQLLDLRERRVIPLRFFAPLFHISVWQKPAG